MKEVKHQIVVLRWVSTSFFSYPGCHLSVMTHPRSYKESQLSTLTEEIQGILFKGMEPSQGRIVTTQQWHVSLLYRGITEQLEK